LSYAEQFVSAALLYEAILQVQPDHYEVQVGLAQSYLEQGDAQEALQTYQRALTQVPERPEAAYGLALTHAQLGNLTARDEALSACLQLAPYQAAMDYQLDLLVEQKQTLLSAETVDAAALAAANGALDQWYRAYEVNFEADRAFLQEYAQFLLEQQQPAQALPLLQKAKTLPLSLWEENERDVEELLLMCWLLTNQIEPSLMQLPHLALYETPEASILDLLEPLYHSDVKNASITAALGAVLTEIQPLQAVAYLTEALEEAPMEPALYAHRALLYYRSKGVLAAWQEVEQGNAYGFSELGCQLQLEWVNSPEIKALLKEQGQDAAVLAEELQGLLAVERPENALYQLHYAQTLSMKEEWTIAYPFFERALQGLEAPQADLHEAFAQAAVATARWTVVLEQTTLALEKGGDEGSNTYLKPQN
jgi:tetratricopeptide (TPR) repeat protein